MGQFLQERNGLWAQKTFHLRASKLRAQSRSTLKEAPSMHFLYFMSITCFKIRVAWLETYFTLVLFTGVWATDVTPNVSVSSRNTNHIHIKAMSDPFVMLRFLFTI